MAFRFDQKIKDFQRLKRDVPRRVGNIAKNHFLKAFKDEGFTEETVNPWAKRTTKNRSDRNNPARRALLVNRGHLRRSIRVGRTSWDRVEVGSYGITYAKFHNNPSQGSKIPRRKFVGSSKVMTRQISNLVRKEFKKIF
jgi:phage gpG-like protein